jgi:hypothetical protein
MERTDVEGDRTPETDALDMAWQVGTLRVGRPFRAELWCADQITVLTFFMSRQGLDTATNSSIGALLQR